MFVVKDKIAGRGHDTVVAPAGYYRTASGRIVRDGTPSPEMGPSCNAFLFASHRSAARVANTLANAEIREGG